VRAAAEGCKPAGEVMSSVNGTDEDKPEYIRKHMPAAIEVCDCAASPEHLGGLLEALFAS
jgi:hypothetical protein